MSDKRGGLVPGDPDVIRIARSSPTGECSASWLAGQGGAQTKLAASSTLPVPT